MDIASVKVRVGHREQALLPSAIFLLILATSFCLGMYVFQYHSERWMFWVSYIIFGTLLSFLLIFKFPKDPFEPIMPVTAMYFFYFYLRGFYLSYEQNLYLANPFVVKNLYLLDKVMLYVTLGLLLFFIGYYSPAPRFLARGIGDLHSQWNPATIQRKARTLFFLGLPFVVSRIWGYSPFKFGEEFTSGLFMVLSYLCYISLFVYAILYFSPEYRRKVSREWFFFVIALLLVLGLLTRYREPMILIIFILVVAHHYVKKSLSLKRLVFYGLIVVFLISPIGIGYRGATFSSTLSVKSRILQMPSAMLESVERYTGGMGNSSFITRYLIGFGEAMIDRLHGTDSVIAIVALVPDEKDYEWGKTIYFTPISAFIPRLIWPGKPETGLGEFFRDNYWLGTGGRIAVTQVGELYLNFGLIGILLGMGVLGIFHRAFYEYFIRNKNYNALIFYGFSLFFFLAIERSFALTYATFIKLSVLLFFVFRYLNGKPLFKRA